MMQAFNTLGSLCDILLNKFENQILNEEWFTIKYFHFLRYFLNTNKLIKLNSSFLSIDFDNNIICIFK